MKRLEQSGFSLIETLVAMAVLAVSATAILSATETHTHTVSAVTERTLARWIAQNSLVVLEQGRQAEATVQMGRGEWQVRVARSDTVDPDLQRVDIAVARLSAANVVLARLTGFVDVTREAVE
ncbi:type II secretion system minor pseudopilin GspI [uncultured Tateyamaria sp.]|uniref:type II secretion system minor pseudopilin GspI n=1 Tax=uncultured Tateyamaria sp. TaxID=455651 RepID=UPI00262360C6|nr:type II secretion system minor pseudopilin GspI [uncultured Tateyamaria sp.]